MGPDLLEVYNPWTGEIVKTTHSNLMSIIRTLNKLSRPVKLWTLLYAFGLEQTVPSKGVDILSDSSESLGVRTARLNDKIVLEFYIRTDL